MRNFAYYSKKCELCITNERKYAEFRLLLKKCELCITNERNYGEFLVRLIFHGNSAGES